MQAKPFHTSPLTFPSSSIGKSITRPSTTQLRANVHIPRAISIAVPSDQVLTRDVDDEMVAFRDYQSLFMSQRLEVSNPIKLKAINGAIPKDFPSGTYYLTGPGILTDDHGSMVHPLDGHGYLRAFEIDGPNGEVRFMAKYVKTEAQSEECDAINGSWRFTHRGPFSVLRGGKMVGNVKVMKNVANTTVLGWGRRLFCLWEGGAPYEIDPRTLDTIGRFHLIDGEDRISNDGSDDTDVGIWDVVARLLKPILYGVLKMPGKRILSHYKVDDRKGSLVILSCNAEDMLLPRSHFTFYEYDRKLKLKQKREFKIGDHLMIHDWAFTDSHYILFANRIKLDVFGSMGAVCGVSPMISALKVNPSELTCPIYALPRNSKNTPGEWRNPINAPSQMWLLHAGNAYEDIKEDGSVGIKVHAVTCSYRWFNFLKLFGYNWQSDKLDPSTMNARQGEEQLLPHLVEVSIHLDAQGNHQKCNVNPLNRWTSSCDFPTVNPKFSGYKHQHLYVASSSGARVALPHFPFDAIVKLNTKNKGVYKWTPGTRRFVGEPVFVSKVNRAGEDDGYLLVIEYAVGSQRCNLVILDAKEMGTSDAVVARFEVPPHLTFPLGFHGTWVPNQPLSDVSGSHQACRCNITPDQ